MELVLILEDFTMWHVLEENVNKINANMWPPDLRISEYSGTLASIKGDQEIIARYIRDIKTSFTLDSLYSHYRTRTLIALCKNSL